MQSVICGNGPMGRALATALAEAGHHADILGRPPPLPTRSNLARSAALSWLTQKPYAVASCSWSGPPDPMTPHC